MGPGVQFDENTEDICSIGEELLFDEICTEIHLSSIRASRAFMIIYHDIMISTIFPRNSVIGGIHCLNVGSHGIKEPLLIWKLA
jgi:hypothetical protein